MTEKKQDLDDGQRSWVRIILTSNEIRPLEKVCNEVIMLAKDKNVRLKGPVRVPTKTLRITTRKTPCGEGSKTWDRYQMRIHKRVIDLYSTPEVIQQLSLCDLDPSVYAEVRVEGRA